VPDSYASVAGFAADTTNFFALNDAAVAPGPDGRRRFDVVLASAPVAVPPGARLVVASSPRGLILFRTLITSDAELPALRALQAQQRCEPALTKKNRRRREFRRRRNWSTSTVRITQAGAPFRGLTMASTPSSGGRQRGANLRVVVTTVQLSLPDVLRRGTDTVRPWPVAVSPASRSASPCR